MEDGFYGFFRESSLPIWFSELGLSEFHFFFFRFWELGVVEDGFFPLFGESNMAIWFSELGLNELFWGELGLLEDGFLVLRRIKLCPFGYWEMK